LRAHESGDLAVLGRRGRVSWPLLARSSHPAAEREVAAVAGREEATLKRLGGPSGQATLMRCGSGGPGGSSVAWSGDAFEQFEQRMALCRCELGKDLFDSKDPFVAQLFAHRIAFRGEVEQDRATVVRVGSALHQASLFEYIDLWGDRPGHYAEDDGQLSHAQLLSAVSEHAEDATLRGGQTVRRKPLRLRGA